MLIGPRRSHGNTWWFYRSVGYQPLAQEAVQRWIRLGGGWSRPTQITTQRFDFSTFSAFLNACTLSTWP